MKVLIFSPGKHIHRNYILPEPVAKLYLPSILKRNLKTKHSGHYLEHSINTIIIIIYIIYIHCISQLSLLFYKFPVVRIRLSM